MALQKPFLHRKCNYNVCKSVLLVMLMVSVLVNISFLLDTNSKLQTVPRSDLLILGHGRHLEGEPVIEMNQFPGYRSLQIDVVSSKQMVMVKLDGRTVFISEEFDVDRGIHLLVLNEATGVVMARKVFDTYLGHEDEAMVQFLSSISPQRILVFAIKDEGTFQLKDSAKEVLTNFGSEIAYSLFWRDMWAYISQGKKKVGEKFSSSASLESWGDAVSLSVNVSLVSYTDSQCKFWPDDTTTLQRRQFCDKYEGYASICRCDNPEPLLFPRVTLKNGEVLDVPLSVIASNRPEYLFRTLKTLLQTPGVSKDKITVFIDGYYDEPLDITRLLNVRGVQHAPLGKNNARISQHYKASLTATFNFFPDSEYVILLEEDLQISPDFFNYFHQTMPLLDEDKMLYCISAWNDQGYNHSCKDPALLYRIEGMPGLGWMMKKSLFKDELESMWPTSDKQWDWDMWMRHQPVRKSRECIIPDISRTYHFGSKGLNINPYFQELYFQSHSLQSKPNVKLRDVDKMTGEKYEVLVRNLIKSAKVLDHSKDPCSENFIPDTDDATFVLFIKMDTDTDFETWKQLAKCYKLWDLDVRGFHKSMWRQYRKGKHLVIVGVPASPYAEFKPTDITPIYLEEKKTEEKKKEEKKIEEKKLEEKKIEEKI